MIDTNLIATLTNAQDAFSPSQLSLRPRIYVYYHETGRYRPPTADGIPLCQKDGFGGTIAYSQNYPRILRVSFGYF